MATPTYIALATTTLSGGETSVTFSSIPSSYRDLVAVITPLHASGTHGGRMRFNSDTGSNYSSVQMAGDGSSASSSSGTTTALSNWVAKTTVSSVIFQIMDYSATDKHKTLLLRNNKNTERVSMIAGRWASTSAITSISLFTLPSGGYTSGTFSLWGSNRL